MFYYNVHIVDPVNNVNIWAGFVQAQNETLEFPSTPSHWQSTSMISFVPGNGLFGTTPNIYFYQNMGLQPPGGTSWNYTPNAPGAGPSTTGHECDSREVVVSKQYNHEEYFNDFYGNPWKVRVSFTQGSWLWLTSGLVIEIIPN